MRRAPRWIARLLGDRLGDEAPLALAERLARLEPPLSTAIRVGGPLLAYLPAPLRRLPGLREIERFLLASGELSATTDRGERTPRVIGDPITSRARVATPFAPRYDVIVVGSGTGGSIAAAEAARTGRRVLVVEEGPAIPSGRFAPHGGRQSLEQLRGGGGGLVLGRPPALVAEGRTLGGGSEVNSGFYHRLEGARRATWIAAAGSSETEWLALECELEERLSVSEAPVRTARHPLELGALELGLPVERTRVWSRLERGRPAHQGALRTYLADAQAAKARLESGLRALSVAPGSDGVRLLVERDGERRELLADELVLAAGTIETPRLLVRSGLARPHDLSFALAPMLRVAGIADHPVAHEQLPEPIVARSADGRFKFATAAGTRAYLRATLRGLGVDPDRTGVPPERLFACYASFVPEGAGGFVGIGGSLFPFMRWTRADRAAMGEASEALRVLLRAGGAEALWPSDGASGVSAVHLGGSLPLGSRLVDGDGRLRAERRIRLSDASLLPGLPWVNPGGPLSVLALLLARRAAGG